MIAVVLEPQISDTSPDGRGPGAAGVFQSSTEYVRGSDLSSGPATANPDLSDGFVLGDCLVLPQKNAITRPGHPTAYTEPKMMEVLLHLARAGGELVERRELLDSEWYEDADCDGALTRVVCALRRTLGDDCRHPKYIGTVHKHGYRLLVDARPVNSGARAGLPVNTFAGRSVTSRSWEKKTAGRPSLFEELKRRRVFRVAVAYLVVTWAMVQIAETTFPALGVPEWCLTLLVLLVALGFPLAIALAWAVQLTADGPVLEMPVARQSDDQKTLSRSGLRFVIVTALLLVIGLLGYELFVPTQTGDPPGTCGPDDASPLISDIRPM